MKKILLVLLMSIGLMAGGDIAIESQTVPDRLAYVGIAVNANETYMRSGNQDFIGYGDEFTDVGITVIAGYKFQRWEDTNVAIEVRVGSSFWMEDSEDITTTTAGIYLKPTYGDRIGVYGLIGVTEVNWDGRYDSINAASFSLGLGVFANVADDIYIYADYMMNFTDVYLHFFDDNVNLDQAIVGIAYRF